MENDITNAKVEHLKRFSQGFTPPYRVGRKQNRAVLDSQGREVIVFPQDNGQAQVYCDILNSIPETQPSQSNQLRELKEACETVVNGYENNGMENMNIRDEVFYKSCKVALSKLK